MIKADTIIDFTLTYNLYKKPMYNYVRKMLNDKSLTEDVVQNVFLKFYENLSVIKNINSPGNWLFVTARNEVFGLLRRKKVRNENYMDEDFECTSDINVENDVEELEVRDIIEREIKSMDDDSKEIFVLREYSGLSYHEISDIIGMEEGIVKGRLFRTRQRLIDKISKLVR